MAAKKSRRSARKPRDTPRGSSADSLADVRLIIQDNLIQFMGRRFPEFCALRAACRVSVRASPSATGDDRVASYQAAINSIAGRHYTHWPFMVEVLNKWLEMNQDFVRDPLGYIASNPSSALTSAIGKDHPTTTSTLDVTIQATTSIALIPSDANSQRPPTATGDANLPLSDEAGAPGSTVGSPLAVLTTGTEPNDLVDPPSSSDDGGSTPVPLWGVVPLSWIGALRLLSSLGNLGVGKLTSVIAFSSSRNWSATPLTQQIPDPPKMGWLRLSILVNSYKGWWEIFRKPFAFRSG